ncbi:TIGR02710 family CRISPR-associated protein [candidate division BRC1 bacterium HGW-BRC1-1]|jgi:CRISPR-associated protein (TIGR02710 family)|nr:MAG: TIGR02710 family CRISPR-associated protein [candidate division BRC1 bacterium HGW-BRC1-1]
MATALICTVGTTLESGEDLVELLSNEIRELAPAFVLFLASRESSDHALRVAAAVPLGESAFAIVQVESPHNINDIFEKTNDSIRELRMRGYGPDQILIDYTTGTKVMAAGAVLAAVMNQCCQLRYLFYNGHETERVLTAPESVMAFRDLLLARRLIREMRFRSAYDLLSHIDSTDLSPYDVDSLNALRDVALSYRHWDNFRYEEFLETIPKVPTQLEPIQKFLIAPDTLEMIRTITGDLAAGRYSPPVLADMLNNAERRLREGKLDDAAARVYRALEMLSQWLLAEQGIDTNDVDTRRIPPRFRVNFEAMRSLDEGIVRIGMRKAFELLTILETPAGLRFDENRNLATLLQHRSDSILAHGTKSLGEVECVELVRTARAFFVEEVEGFADLCNQLQFRWLVEGF